MLGVDCQIHARAVGLGGWGVRWLGFIPIPVERSERAEPVRFCAKPVLEPFTAFEGRLREGLRMTKLNPGVVFRNVRGVVHHEKRKFLHGVKRQKI